MRPAIRIEMSDFEQVWGTIQTMLLHPFENNLYHIIPMLGAFTWYHSPIVPTDYGQNSMVPKDLSQKFFQAVEILCKCARLKSKIDIYTSLTFHFTSFGGRFSCTKPIIVIPYHRLFRPCGSSFCDNADQNALRDDIHALSDDETKFFIAREIAHIKFGDVFLKTAARIAFLTTICFLYGASLSWGGIAAVAMTATSLALLIDRVHEYAIDLFAIKTLGNALGDPERALLAAVSALEKERKGNLEKRLQNFFCRLYLTSSGNNLLDLKHPFLSWRIHEIGRYWRLRDAKTAPAVHTSPPMANDATVPISG